MTHTVVGLFDNRSEAQAAMQELIQSGFSQDSIDLSNGSYQDTGTATSTAANSAANAGDGIANFFNSLFSDDTTTANTYTNAARGADAVLAVQVDSQERATQAAQILDSNGAIDVDDRTSGSDTADTKRTAANTQGTAIPVIEEQLQVGKRQVEGGGARVRSRIIEKPVEASVRLREEHVVVNRRPVDRPVTDADMNNFREGDIELTERAEVPVVNKQARVVEEVEVGKQVSEREQVVRDTVRRTDVDVQETETDTTTDRNTRTAGR